METQRWPDGPYGCGPHRVLALQSPGLRVDVVLLVEKPRPDHLRLVTAAEFEDQSFPFGDDVGERDPRRGGGHKRQFIRLIEGLVLTYARLGVSIIRLISSWPSLRCDT